jgi:hypothetical protein
MFLSARQFKPAPGVINIEEVGTVLFRNCPELNTFVAFTADIEFILRIHYYIRFH